MLLLHYEGKWKRSNTERKKKQNKAEGKLEQCSASASGRGVDLLCLCILGALAAAACGLPPTGRACNHQGEDWRAKPPRGRGAPAPVPCLSELVGQPQSSASSCHRRGAPSPSEVRAGAAGGLVPYLPAPPEEGRSCGGLLEGEKREDLGFRLTQEKKRARVLFSISNISAVQSWSNGEKPACFDMG